jgi:hypothetical protein
MENSTDYGYGFNRPLYDFDVPAAFCGLEKSVGQSTGSIIDRMGTYAADDAKNQGAIEARQSLADNLQTKVITDQSATQALNNAIGIKALNDQAAVTVAQLTAFERDYLNRANDDTRWTVKSIHDESDKAVAQTAVSLLEVKNQLRAIELAELGHYGDLKFEGLKNTSAILEKMAGDKYDNMKDKIDALREECERGKWEKAIVGQTYETASLKNMINSVDQNQRFASKTVQFGTGNTSGTAQTANQG